MSAHCLGCTRLYNTESRQDAKQKEQFNTRKQSPDAARINSPIGSTASTTSRSTSVKEDEHDHTSVTPGDDDKNSKPGLFKRFKIAYKMYGRVLVGVHLATSAVWFSGFYIAAANMDIVSILTSLGSSPLIIKPFMLPGVGNIAVMYLLYKMATPARYMVTLGGTQLAYKWLLKRGYIQKPPEGERVRDIMRDKYGDVKDDMREGIRDRYGNMKDRYGEYKVHVNIRAINKYDDMRSEIKDKYHDRREQMKHKYSEYKDEAKEKYSDYKEEAKDRYSEYKVEAKDKISEYKDEAKEKYSEYKVEAKDRYSEYKDDTKSKYSDYKEDAKGRMHEGLDELKEKYKETYKDKKDS